MPGGGGEQKVRLNFQFSPGRSEILSARYAIVLQQPLSLSDTPQLFRGLRFVFSQFGSPGWR